MRVLKIDLLSPGDDKNETENGIIKIINFEGLDDKLSFEIFAINDTVNEAEDDGLIKFDNSGEKKKSSGCDNCCEL